MALIIRKMRKKATTDFTVQKGMDKTNPITKREGHCVKEERVAKSRKPLL